MGASSVTGTGQGSAEGKLRGLGIDQLQKVLAANSNKSSVIIDNEINRVQFIDESNDSNNLIPPKIIKLDAKAGIVYFENPTEEQIEIYKYTRKNNGIHHHKKGSTEDYSPRLGKRYKVLYQLKKGAISWTVPSQWIFPGSGKHQTNLRSHFKFGVRNTDGIRSDLSVLTVITANSYEYANNIKILLENCGGGGKSS